ncbi:hypothetical protein G6F31_020045 [Rhizopus arrhizus]|nr:hypothetical protein G6F31_020045 [Rhizopus arrhizus]
MKASRDFAEAPRSSGRPRPLVKEQRSGCWLSTMSRQTAWSLTATSRPMVSPDAAASAAMSGCASLIRKDDWSKPQASWTHSGPGPYSPSCSATNPQRLSNATCRYSVLWARPVFSANAAIVSVPSCRANVANT